MKKITIESWIKKINTQKDRIAKERDRLRELIDEMNDIDGCCEEALNDMTSAADHIGELL